MKRTLVVIFLVAILLPLGGSVAMACDVLCVHINTPWGEEIAECLVFYIDDGPFICIAFHNTCIEWEPCRNGYPIA